MHIVDDSQFTYNGNDMHPEFQHHLINYITSTGTLGDAQRHLLETDTAKYVRPTFVFACGEAIGLTKDQLLAEASAVELMHTATLLHDDIIDEAKERRGKQSANEKHGSKIALLAGDGMLAKALALLLETPHADRAVAEAAATLVHMTEAVAQEIEVHNTGDASEQDLLHIVDGKTGVLFALSGYLAGLAGNSIETAEQFSKLGMQIGQVFQIKDDLNDMDEDRQVNIVTLPILIGEQMATERINELTTNIQTSINDLNVDQQSKKKLLVTIGGIIRTPLL